ncbi:MAG: hypothetical protein H7308_19945 [Chthonomonadaceae bacterium]|nr:hypothetical protein [Chthonomonadaceae bacterium]
MKNFHYPLLLTFGLLFGHSASLARSGKPEKKSNQYVFKRLFHKGDVVRYRITSTMKHSDNSELLNNEYLATETVEEIKEDGSVIVAVHAEAVNSPEISEAAEKPNPDFKINYDRDGNFVPPKTLDALPVQYYTTVHYPDFAYPDKPLKFGETWKFKKKGDERGRGEVTGKYKLVGIEKPGKDLPVETLHAEIKTSTVLGSGGETQSVWNLHLDAKTGTLVKAEMKIDEFPLPQERVKWRVVRVIEPETKQGKAE